ncbi:isoprenyl transferase [Virgibacillus sp. AGTR]|uniref:Isoprenyl transferase n=1 Tax=Virgibacillus salarius TaxID=447199 RepID=A0A941DTM1_9BACI|nr:MULTISPECIES: isoprenyl transferase [Bacillaceae]NAZ09214.1 isoprenyl transferase [Agaribacter marinus]MBR7796505.1 isoprenyl transferase [Virgibacillus salarius]MCC2252499.1 isoprenyl transferase [Virgibacillus sp. AGTR]MDY7043745.1 isoprenyl transferase [Virgibacillus sp. M23]QRZ19409.1 isoprenyl transferase [Virgibacillus sp. AGTR]
MNAYIPTHVAIMMDGNGRWGKQRGLTRSEGHYAGAQAMEHIIDASIELNIKVLTLYAFSSENWSRPKDEVNYLMQLPVKFFKQKLPEFQKRNIMIRLSGNIDELPKRTKQSLIQAVEETKNNTGIVVNFAFNYGGRADILQAIRKIIDEARNEQIDINQVDEKLFRNYLYTSELPDPELVIRTGGEKRVSNFLLWQSSMAELYFSDVYFPDFNEQELCAAIREFQRKQWTKHSELLS